MICKIEGCGRKSIYKMKRLCGKHYQRWRKCGDPQYAKYEMHGYRYHPLYNIWCIIKSKCCNENYRDYKYYGGRGITVCDEWKNDPVKFIKWCLENGWQKGLEIDRRDNDGNYCPENCHFVTRKENVHNRRLLMNNNTSGYCGVSSYGKKWVAHIGINDKNKHLGYFNTPEEAALAYDKAIPDNRPRNFK